MYWDNGNIQEEKYYKDGKICREDGPVSIWYDTNGRIQKEAYYANERLHRLEGPAVISYNENKEIVRESYYIDGKEYEDIFQYMVLVGSLRGE